jgi:hypothetical protein
LCKENNTCKKYRLKYKKVRINDAKKAINEGRPLVATFYLDGKGW